MKAKDLIKILEQNPEAEVVYNDNEQMQNFVKVTGHDSFDKGSCAEYWQNDHERTIAENETFKVDVIVLY